MMRRARGATDLIAGWMIATFGFVMMAVIVKPIAIALFVCWMFITLSVAVDLSRSVRSHRRMVRELEAAMTDPRRNRIVTIELPPSPPQVGSTEPSGMILLPPQDRDPRWNLARTRQGLHHSGQLHVDRVLRPLTDCPVGHYDYHELRSSSLDRAVRRCAWCPPAVGTWTEGLVVNEDSER